MHTQALAMRVNLSCLTSCAHLYLFESGHETVRLKVFWLAVFWLWWCRRDLPVRQPLIGTHCLSPVPVIRSTERVSLVRKRCEDIDDPVERFLGINFRLSYPRLVALAASLTDGLIDKRHRCDVTRSKMLQLLTPHHIFRPHLQTSSFLSTPQPKPHM